MTNSREAFEQAYWEKQEIFDIDDKKTKDFIFKLNPNGEYSSVHVRAAWCGYQAALATVEQEPICFVINENPLHRMGCLNDKGRDLPVGTKLYTHPQPDSKLVEENARLLEALKSILGWRELRSGANEIPIERIEQIADEALNKEGV